MDIFRLRYVMYDPSESTEDDKYMADIPALPGCRVWGDTPEETLDILQGVAEAYIESYREWGDELPEEVKAALVETDRAEEILVVA